jgi:hypothetical protein
MTTILASEILQPDARPLTRRDRWTNFTEIPLLITATVFVADYVVKVVLAAGD